MKQLIREIEPYVKLYRDSNNGIAWIEDGHTGMGHSCHPNIDITGSVRGMKNLGYWDKKAKTVRSHGWIYNISVLVICDSDSYDVIVAKECNCECCLMRRENS